MHSKLLALLMMLTLFCAYTTSVFIGKNECANPAPFCDGIQMDCFID
ncbi:7916_t:CDS:2, partial [Funneliformis caledonium]